MIQISLEMAKRLERYAFDYGLRHVIRHGGAGDLAMRQIEARMRTEATELSRLIREEEKRESLGTGTE